jgi:hypothetical protein
MDAAGLKALLQNVYFNNVDTANAEAAVAALAPDVHWQHTQVWAHDGHDSRHTDRLAGRDAVHAFLAERVTEMQRIRITHHVDDVVTDGERGAFRARVVGPDGSSKGFVGWVEVADNRLKRYIVMPEDFASGPTGSP